MSVAMMDHQTQPTFGSGSIHTELSSPTKKRPLDKDDRDSKRKKKKTKHADDTTKKSKSTSKESSASSTKKPKSTTTVVQEDPINLEIDEGPTIPTPSQPPTSPDSLIFLETFSLFLPLAPICQDRPLAALCAEHLSPLLLTYFHPFRGVVLAYENVRLLSGKYSRAQVHAIVSTSTINNHEQQLQTSLPSPDSSMMDDIVDTPTSICDVAPISPTHLSTNPEAASGMVMSTYGPTFVWVTADFILFRPRIGSWMEGSLNLQTESHLSIVCWNLFNVSIDRSRLPSDWDWVSSEGDDYGNEAGNYDEDTGRKRKYQGGGEGYYIDASGEPVKGPIKFRILDFDSVAVTDRDSGILSIEGSLLTIGQAESGPKSKTSSKFTTRAGSGSSSSGVPSSTPAPRSARTGHARSATAAAAAAASNKNPGTHVKFS